MDRYSILLKKEPSVKQIADDRRFAVMAANGEGFVEDYDSQSPIHKKKLSPKPKPRRGHSDWGLSRLWLR